MSISLSEGTINKHPIIGEVDFSELERVYPMEDGSFSACLEQNGALIACYWDGEVLHYYTSLQGPFQWGMGAGYFLLALGAELLVVAVVWVVWFRKRKDRQREKRRFISVRTRISVISLLVTAVGTVGILWVSAVVIEQYSQEREQTSSANAAQTFMSLIGSGWKLQAGEEGFLTLPTDVSQSLDSWVEEQQKQGLPYSYEVFSYQNDRWYCIYSADLAGYAPAEYVVGEGVQQSFARAMDTGLIQSVEERRSIGTLQYSINYGTYAVSATQTHGCCEQRV